MTETREILKPPYPPYIDMGRCPDCTLDWRMDRSEYKNWIEKKLPLGWTLPSRCPECRVLRRQSQAQFGNKVRAKRTALGRRLFALANDVRDGVYEDQRHELAMMLLSLTEEAESIPETTESKKPHENKRPVQLHSREISDSDSKKSG